MTTRNTEMTMVEYFKACDAANAVPVSDSERARCAVLTARARTVGLAGDERGEWMRLVQRGGQR